MNIENEDYFVIQEIIDGEPLRLDVKRRIVELADEYFAREVRNIEYDKLVIPTLIQIYKSLSLRGSCLTQEMEKYGVLQEDLISVFLYKHIGFGTYYYDMTSKFVLMGEDDYPLYGRSELLLLLAQKFINLLYQRFKRISNN